ncbi:MAG: DUF1631 domain-containing protein [Gammaproteobacteria bacterium]|nr:DUF1631 domain-containing protein [Gammaproteobacteria bacterium]
MSSDSDTPDNKNNPDLKDPEYISKAIKNFIHGDSDTNTNAPKAATAQAAEGKQFHDRRDIIKALTSLQLTYHSEYQAGQQVNINTDSFKSALLNSMAKISNSAVTKSVNQIDGRTIDFVEMIFGAFLRDDNISAAIKNLLLRLQIPAIKIAMLDNQFFHNDKHPARHVLDTIAHLGIGIDDVENTLYKTMGLIVEQLLNTFDQNIASFNTALIALNRLTKIEKEKNDEQEAITHQQILKEHARHVVLTELQYQTKNKVLPKEIKPLILKYWSTLMLHKFARHGKESAEWNEVVNLLKQLIYSLQPVKSKDQFLLLKYDSASLVDEIREHLYSTKQNREAIDAIINKLGDIHQQRIDESEFDVDEELDFEFDAGAIIPEAEDDLVQKQLEKEAQAKEQISRLPSNVKLGVWFEVYTGNNRALRRLKLSIILFDEAKLVFVDRMGNKVLEKHATEFVEELEANQSRIIDDHSIFNHALGQVIAGLVPGK